MMKVDVKKFKIFVTVCLLSGVLLGIVSTLLISDYIDKHVRDLKSSEVGITILTTNDPFAKVPKGTLVEGTAVEVEFSGFNKIVETKTLVTPFVTEKDMLIACAKEGEYCVLYANPCPELIDREKTKEQFNKILSVNY